MTGDDILQADREGAHAAFLVAGMQANRTDGKIDLPAATAFAGLMLDQPVRFVHAHVFYCHALLLGIMRADAADNGEDLADVLALMGQDAARLMAEQGDQLA